MRIGPHSPCTFTPRDPAGSGSIKRVCKIADPEALSLLQLAARQAVGVPPDQRRKARVKALASEYPSAAAI